MTEQNKPQPDSAQPETPVFQQVSLIEAIYNAVSVHGVPWAERSQEWKANYEQTINFLVCLATDGSEQRRQAGADDSTHMFATLFTPRSTDDWLAGAEAIRKDGNGTLSTYPLPAEMNVPDYADGMLKLGIAMKALEEALPNGQLNRTGFAVQALFDGVSTLQRWFAARVTLDNKQKQDKLAAANDAANKVTEHHPV